jgi:2-iminobutanoate/2-iminopropanoate deaminase
MTAGCAEPSSVRPTDKVAIGAVGAPPPGGPYSHAIGAGGFLFASGQRPVDPVTGDIPEGVTAQTHAVFANLLQVLASAGSSPEGVVKVTAHLSDIAFFDEFNAVYTQYFHPPYPARTTVGSVLRGILVEIDVIALWPGPDAGSLQ